MAKAKMMAESTSTLMAMAIAMESRTGTHPHRARNRTFLQIIQLVFCLTLISISVLSVGVNSSLLPLQRQRRTEQTSLVRRDHESVSVRVAELLDRNHDKVQIIEDDDDGEYYFEPDNQRPDESHELARAGGARVRRTRSSNPYPYSYERRVLYRAEEGPPKIQPTVSNVQAVVGSNATLECFIESYPKSVNYWIINSERLRADTDKYKISDDRTSVRSFEYRDRLRLHIINVDGSDYSSVFRCFATNAYGTNYKAIRIEGHAPIIESSRNLTTVEASLGSGFVLECIISAVPDGINYWTRLRRGSASRGRAKDELVNATSRISLTHHPYKDNLYKSVFRLRVMDVEIEDFTGYKCKSKNRNGEAERKFQVIKSSHVLPKRNDKLTSSAPAAVSLPIAYKYYISLSLELILIISTSLFITSVR